MLGAMPQVKDRIVQMIEDIGFDPNDDTEDTTTPIGIGNTVGNRIVEWSYSDGANQVLLPDALHAREADRSYQH